MTDVDCLTGTWQLTACILTLADGSVHRPYGSAPVGVILYTPEGWMSCHMAYGGDGAASGPKQAYSSYHGPFTVDEAARIVTHHVIGAFDPQMVGTDQPRAYRFVESSLILSAAIQDRTVEVVWTRQGTAA